MELKGAYQIAAPRERVWAMLNDPNVLAACIPGCESLSGSIEEGFAARVTTKIGPVKATFNGAVQLSDLNPPESYRISGEGKGGVAGFARGGADVKLAEADGGTLLTYDVQAQVGGKLAQLGSRLIDATAKRLADEFFSSFAAKAGAPVSEAPVVAAAAQPTVADAAMAPSVAGATATAPASLAPSPAPAPDLVPAPGPTPAPGAVPPAQPVARGGIGPLITLIGTLALLAFVTVLVIAVS
jgi:carbon monoxide dehydrogenase subunit G